MAIDKRYRISHPRNLKQAVELNVSVSGMVITVEAGTFTAGGVDHQLTDNEEVTVAPPAEDLIFHGFLVLDGDNGDVVRLLADFVGKDDSGYDFEASQRYTYLYDLLYAMIPEGTASLDDVDLVVWSSVKERPSE